MHDAVPSTGLKFVERQGFSRLEGQRVGSGNTPFWSMGACCMNLYRQREHSYSRDDSRIRTLPQRTTVPATETRRPTSELRRLLTVGRLNSSRSGSRQRRACTLAFADAAAGARGSAASLSCCGAATQCAHQVGRRGCAAGRGGRAGREYHGAQSLVQARQHHRRLLHQGVPEGVVVFADVGAAHADRVVRRRGLLLAAAHDRSQLRQRAAGLCRVGDEALELRDVLRGEVLRRAGRASHRPRRGQGLGLRRRPFHLRTLEEEPCVSVSDRARGAI